MFTVCPKCALTLVVTAADLKVAQGYVRCGRCSNVFNAIVGLSEDRGQQASSSAPGSGSTSASTTIMRKAPSITEDDPLSDTGETEAIYAEPKPEPQEVKLQEVFVEPEAFVNRPAARATAATSSRPALPSPKVAGPSASRSVPASPPKPPGKSVVPPEEQRYDDNSEIPESALEFDPSETDVTKVFVEPAPTRKIDMTGTQEKLVLKSPDLEPASAPAPRASTPVPKPAPAPAPAPARERDLEDIQIDSELRSLAAKLDATGSTPALQQRAGDANPGVSTAGSPYNSADEPANVALKAAKARRAARPEPPTEFADDVIAADEAGAAVAVHELTGPPPSRGRRIAWISGIAALGVVLAAQAIHHSRNDLATNARFNRPLTRFYAAIGVPLLPNWDLTQYEVRQLGASTGEGENGNLTVRASLKNASNQPLPLPFLRITVQDRYGNRIATRDVPPVGYMPGAVPEGAQINVGQRIDAEMTFKDPGRDAVGFEIDACLPKGRGGISCANDAPAR